jgi:hypothetical protein
VCIYPDALSLVTYVLTLVQIIELLRNGKDLLMATMLAGGRNGMLPAIGQGIKSTRYPRLRRFHSDKKKDNHLTQFNGRLNIKKTASRWSAEARSVANDL